jgi:hypothetical protein
VRQEIAQGSRRRHGASPGGGDPVFPDQEQVGAIAAPDPHIPGVGELSHALGITLKIAPLDFVYFGAHGLSLNTFRLLGNPETLNDRDAGRSWPGHDQGRWPPTRPTVAAGWAHGDLSAYNLLVQDGRLVLIDLPQVVDVVSNPQGIQFLARDARNVAMWFSTHGVPEADGDELAALLAAVAGLTR